MSISVTVNGNPVNIQQGRMVTASPNHSKKEFEKRRLIRLYQVRQQSKNIAEEVRNRVRKEKLKETDRIEKEGEQKLKQWQAKKLIELQNQYHEALKEIGTGHKEANLLEGEDKSFEKRENDDKTAQHRGFIARKKLQEEKNKVRESITFPIQKKKSVRKMEDRRAQMMANLKRSSESIKKINSNQKLPNETDVSGIVTETDLEYEDFEETLVPDTTNIEVNINGSPFNNKKSNVSIEIIEETSTNDVVNESKNVASSENDEQLLRELRNQKDTRISDRIRQRSSTQLLQPDLCDTLQQPLTENLEETNNAHSSSKSKRDSATTTNQTNMFPNVQQNIYTCACKQPVVIQNPCNCTPSQFKNSSNAQLSKKPKTSSKLTLTSSPKKVTQQPKLQTLKEIPTKPKITLKSVISKNDVESQIKTKRTGAVSSYVEKIYQDNLITQEEEPENDFFEKMRRRDQDALIRGQKALEREKLQREYNELMKKLPALQKLERLNEMNQDKPEYHMTEDRLREQERKKQSILDNTYEKLFPDRRPPTITIPIKSTSKDVMKDRNKLQENENSINLNLGSWDSERKNKKLYTEEEVEAILREGKIPSESKFRTEQLKSVLEKLRKRKEELLKEIPNLPENTKRLSEVIPIPDLKRLTEKKTTTTTTSETLKENHKSEKRKNVKITKENVVKSSKKSVSVKVGTTPHLQSSSSYETIDEPIRKQPKTTKNTKSSTKTTQVSQKSTSTKEHPKTTKKITKKRRSEKESISSTEPSSNSDLKKSSDEPSVFPVQHPTKKLKQNEIPIAESLPSVPVNSLVSLEDKNKRKIEKPSTCCCNKDIIHKNNSELCEIVIKIKDRKHSEVHIQDKNEDGSIKTVISRKPESRKEEKIKVDESIPEKKCSHKKDNMNSSSWHRKFTKNNSQVSTSSTSYASPPQLPNKKVETKAPSNLCQLISKKPQQENVKVTQGSPPTKLPAENRDIFNDIKKLLTMSRLSIDELGVSSISTVTTPSQSIIEMESNKPTSTAATTSTYLNKTEKSEQTKVSSNGFPNISFLTVSSDNKTILTNDTLINDKYPVDILEKYAKIAEQCSQRISNLSVMIEKVREEKKKMLETPVAPNDTSTRYMDLPSPIKTVEKHSNESTLTNSSEDSLLKINFSFAEKLKGLTPEEIQNFDKNESKADDELEKRLKALREPITVVDSTKKDNEKYPPLTLDDSNDFVPILGNIPKLPLLSDSTSSKNKRPPPCKAFLSARKLTDDFTQPHELSTIPEQDSQMRLESTLKEKSPRTPKDRSKKLDEDKIKNLIEVVSDKIRNNEPENKSKSSSFSKNTFSPKLKEILNISDSFGSSNTSGDEKTEMYRIEAMLKSIGMDWAIPTLRKTQEALALTSSSSSIDLKSPGNIKEFSDSDIKNYLAKQIYQKISSSTLKSDVTHGSLNESHELSDIQNINFSKKQTSTPINLSEETLKSNDRSNFLKDFYSLNET